MKNSNMALSYFFARAGKFFKVLLIVYLFALVMSSFFSSCFSFRLSQKKIDKAFINLPLQPVQHLVTVNGKTINYAEIGNDSLPVAFFVHGSPGSWSAFVDFMKDSTLLKKVKIVSVDRIGFGYSEFGEGEKSLEKQSAYLLPIVQQYKKPGKKMILIGHSLGGPLIAKMAMDYPQLIDHLIIVAGSISPYLEPNEKWFRIPLNFLPIKILIPKSFRASNVELLYLKPELMKMLPYWKDIRQPVTVIQGNKDIFVRPENAAFAKKMLINSRKLDFIIVDDMNHFVPWSHPQLITNAIDSALLQK
jgi:pimeloyl-ACP methyl ester carboxylesterase